MRKITRYAAWLMAGVAVTPVPAQQVDWPSTRLAHPKRAVIGPYNAVFLSGSDGIERVAQGYVADETLPAMPQWTLHAWIKPTAIAKGETPVVSLGKPGSTTARLFALDDGRPLFRLADRTIRAVSPLAAERWHLLVATGDGAQLRLFVDGRPVGSAQGDAPPPAAWIALGPRLPHQPGFAGKIAGADARADTARRERRSRRWRNGRPTMRSSGSRMPARRGRCRQRPNTG